jgi:uncharacterized protein (DUF488 family)
MGTKEKITVMTVGHSTHSLEEFRAMLEAHGVEKVVDVRTIPKSRRNPQFNKEAMADGLGGTGYVHVPGLGGLRHTKKDSVNTGWRNASFRGYADYMQSEEFAKNIEGLIETARRERVAIMCAEAVPWRCHRSLIADALTVRGVAVEHIFSATSAKPHEMTEFARVEGETITYPAEAEREKGLWDE